MSVGLICRKYADVHLLRVAKFSEHTNTYFRSILVWVGLRIYAIYHVRMNCTVVALVNMCVILPHYISRCYCGILSIFNIHQLSFNRKCEHSCTVDYTAPLWQRIYYCLHHKFTLPSTSISASFLSWALCLLYFPHFVIST